MTWQVEATAGHIRDLPCSRPGPEDAHRRRQDFKPHYQILSGKEKTVARLKELRQKALEIYVASDPDREGESIGWHILQAAGIKNYKRVAFKEITKSGISADFQLAASPGPPEGRLAGMPSRHRSPAGYLVTPELRRVMAGQPPPGACSPSRCTWWSCESGDPRLHSNQALRGGTDLVSPSDGRTWTAEWDPVPVFASKEFPYVQDRQLAELVGAIRNVIVETCIDGEETDTPPAPFISSSLQMAAGR
ncbi:toprim domain-containing protein [Microbulbifer taiwanensis]|uniref:Toprim domain-containing protein n=1 Tax=Microbulbifer taiwanensis TaxID=986746 RepID=A0ABW1YWD2_9GAMM